MLFACASRLEDPSAGIFYMWRWYLVPLWQKQTGVPMWRPTCHGGRVERWDPPSC